MVGTEDGYAPGLGDFTLARQRVLTLRFRSLGGRLAQEVGARRGGGCPICGPIVGFQYRTDADRFLEHLRERLAMFGLELHPDKTRRIEFGRFAEENRERRGEGKPETFDFLGFSVQQKHTDKEFKMCCSTFTLPRLQTKSRTSRERSVPTGKHCRCCTSELLSRTGGPNGENAMWTAR
jgi:hypothetical protein